MEEVVAPTSPWSSPPPSLTNGLQRGLRFEGARDDHRELCRPQRRVSRSRGERPGGRVRAIRAIWHSTVSNDPSGAKNGSVALTSPCLQVMSGRSVGVISFIASLRSTPDDPLRPYQPDPPQNRRRSPSHRRRSSTVLIPPPRSRSFFCKGSIGAWRRVAPCSTSPVARGSSPALRRIWLATGGTVVGVDLNEAMLTVAARARPDITWRQGDVAALPFADGSFDTVLCQMALMFFADRPAALREMARVTAEDGTVAGGPSLAPSKRRPRSNRSSSSAHASPGQRRCRCSPPTSCAVTWVS